MALLQSEPNLISNYQVKCDEAKPVCNRCTSTGHTCDGYAPNYALKRMSSQPGVGLGTILRGRSFSRSSMTKGRHEPFNTIWKEVPF